MTRLQRLAQLLLTPHPPQEPPTGVLIFDNEPDAVFESELARVARDTDAMLDRRIREERAR